MQAEVYCLFLLNRYNKAWGALDGTHMKKVTKVGMDPKVIATLFWTMPQATVGVSDPICQGIYAICAP